MKKIKNISNKIKEEILKGSYQEPFKFDKDISLILDIDHPKRKKIEFEMNFIVDKLSKIKNG